ncbi:MAG: hypothetical protein K2K60_00465 [Clostridia bacterium]|nr:hypothetical protein [Clostridia bacterium]
MNKYKKIAVAAVSVVMAGAMALPLAACKDKNSGKGADVKPTVDANNKLSYTEGTKLQLAIGHNSDETAITYTGKNIGSLGNYTLMGAKQSESTFKPAWAALQTKLNLSFEDKYNYKSASENLGDIKTTLGIGGVTAFTASAATITAEGANNTLLDINKYLDYMPNYKAFLAANPVAWASLIANSATGAMYMVPYFDGNNDIERFVILRKDIVETLLDGTADITAATKTFADQATAKNGATAKPTVTINGTHSSVTSFMGTTGSWTVDVTDPSVLTVGEHTWGNDKTAVTDANATVKVKVNYTAAHDAAVNTSSTLGAAINTAAGKPYTGDSGNIVDLQNFAINETQGAVKGGDLLAILRAYIDVAYTTEADAPFYTSTNGGLTRASVFNSASAAWDADLYTALGRCFVTCEQLLGTKVKETKDLYLVSGREFTTQRNTDMGSLAGELFGERGLESRYNYSYIDKDGNLKDGRSNAGAWDALKKMNDLAKEGLLNTADNVKKDVTSLKENNAGIQGLSLHDYVQTQTSKYGFNAIDATDYNFAPILTPVSKWDVDGDAETGKEVIMRFTESWRGVKDGGIAVSVANIGNDSNKLAAVLAFIDYCYTNDGQMLMTYGPISTNGNTNPNGLWYATEKTDVNIADIADVSIPATNYSGAQYTLKDSAKASYFIYEGKVYTGTFYNGRQIPNLTTENQTVFEKVAKYNFTDHARKFLGTTLPTWNKDQGFEYLCTAKCGLAGSDIVNIALNNGTVKHQYQTLDGTTGKLDAQGNKIYAGDGTAEKPNYWYTLVPTQLPYSKAATAALSGNLATLSGLGSNTNNFIVSTSKTYRNIITDVMFYGYDSTVAIPYVTDVTVTLKGNAADTVAMLNESGLNTLVDYKDRAWKSLLAWYNK